MQIFNHILDIILPVFLIVVFGLVYARLRGGAAEAEMTCVNRLNMDVLNPLLIFTSLANRDFDLTQNRVLFVAGAAVALGSGLFAWPIARWLKYDVRTFVPPMMYNNCGNIGLPLAAMAFGSSNLGSAVALFVACNLVYFSVGITIMENNRHLPVRIARWKSLCNPMMLAIVLGMFFAFFRLSLPMPLFVPMVMLGSACIPLMLFALGVRMAGASLKNWRIGLVGAAVCPLAGLVAAWLCDIALDLNAAQRAQVYLFAALPPAVFCFVAAERYQQEPDKVASIVLLGNMAAVIFVPLGLWLGWSVES